MHGKEIEEIISAEGSVRDILAGVSLILEEKQLSGVVFV